MSSMAALVVFFFEIEAMAYRFFFIRKAYSINELKKKHQKQSELINVDSKNQYKKNLNRLLQITNSTNT